MVVVVVMEGRRIAMNRSTVSEILHRMVVPRFDFHFATGRRRRRRRLLSQFQHLGVVRIDFTETGRDVVPVSAFGQRREPLGQSHQESASAVVDGLLEEFVDLRGAFPTGFQGRLHQSHHVVAVRMATADRRRRRRQVGDGRGRVDRHGPAGLVVLLQWMLLLLLGPVQLAEQIGIQIASLISRKRIINEEIIYQSAGQLGGQQESGGGGGYPMPLSLEIMASFHHASRKWPQMALFFYNILFLSLGNDLAQTENKST